jgi:hypothetical protein
MPLSTKQKMGRWYDKHPQLARDLEKLKLLKRSTRISIARKLKKLVTTEAPGLIDKTVMNYPLTYKRRWYDADPLLWLTINGLSYCEEQLLHRAIERLRSELKAGK